MLTGLRVATLVLVCLAALAGLGVGAYLIGKSTVPDAHDGDQAFEEARSASFKSAREEAFDTAREAGLKRGRTVGRELGERRGEKIIAAASGGVASQPEASGGSCGTVTSPYDATELPVSATGLDCDTAMTYVEQLLRGEPAPGGYTCAASNIKCESGDRSFAAGEIAE